MKALHRAVACGAALGAAVFFTAASDQRGDRPPGIDEANWIRLSQDAGVAVVRNASAPRTVFTHLYVRRQNIWHQAVMENPTVAWQLDAAQKPPR